MRAAGTSNATLLQRTVVLGALAGALIGELYLLAVTVVIGDWAAYLPAALIGVGFAALAGALDALIALVAVLLLGALRDRVPLAGLVGGTAAAGVPLWVTFHGGWPQADGGAAIGIGLSGAAFLAGMSLAWPVLTGRPWLPPGLAGPVAGRTATGAYPPRDSGTAPPDSGTAPRPPDLS